MLVSYELQIHRGAVGGPLAYRWMAATPFMVPAVQTLIDFPGQGPGIPVIQTAMSVVQISPSEMRQTLFVAF